MKVQAAHTKPDDFGQCEAKRVTPYANDEEGVVFQCKLSATHKLNGISYCLRHARVAALEYLIKAEGKS